VDEDAQPSTERELVVVPIVDAPHVEDVVRAYLHAVGLRLTASPIDDR
jgi:hypothetical protein